eukprot:2006552-Pleurochrysis_carterae.AAC.1
MCCTSTAIESASAGAPPVAAAAAAASALQRRRWMPPYQEMGDSSQDGKARALVEKAEKKINSWSFFSGNKYEDAAELYSKAANQFKVSKNCTSAPPLTRHRSTAD